MWLNKKLLVMSWMREISNGMQKRQLIATSTEMTKMLELSDKDFKVAMVIIYNKLVWTCLKQMKKHSLRKETNL